MCGGLWNWFWIRLLFPLFIEAVVKTPIIEIVVCPFTSSKVLRHFYAVEFQEKLFSFNCHQLLLAISFWQWSFCSHLVLSLFLEEVEPVIFFIFHFFDMYPFLREGSLLPVLSDKRRFHLINMGLEWSWWNPRRIIFCWWTFSPQIDYFLVNDYLHPFCHKSVPLISSTSYSSMQMILR